jgi:hypothetical protein
LRFTVAILNWHGGYQLLFLDREAVEALGPEPALPSVIRSRVLDIVVKRMGKGGESSTSDSLTAATNTKKPEPAPFPQIDLHPNNHKPSSTPNSPHTLTHAATTTSESEYSKYSDGVGPSPPRQVPGASDHSNPTSHSQPHHDGTSGALETSAFPECDDAHAVPKLLPPPPQEGRGPTSDMEADEYDTSRDALARIEPTHTMAIPFTAHGLLPASLQDRQERSAKRPEEETKEAGASLVSVPTKPLPPQTGLPGAVSGQEDGWKHEGDPGAVVTEREYERRLAEERQRGFSNFQKQQFEMEAAQAYQRPISEFPAPSPPSRFRGATHVQRGEESSSSGSLIPVTNTEKPEFTLFPQIDPHPNSPEFSPTPTALDSPPTLTHTVITTDESGYSKYSSGVRPSPPQHPDPYFQPHRRQHDDENSGALAALTFLDRDEAHAVPKSPLPQEGRGLALDMEADGYGTSSESGDDASQDSDSLDGKHKPSFAPPRKGSAKLQAQQDGRVESSSSGLVDAATTSASGNGMLSAPPSSSCAER